MRSGGGKGEIQRPRSTFSRFGLPVLCLAVLSVILAAGLFPFTGHPKNQVTWNRQGSGLHFGEFGSIHSAGDFELPTSPECCSIEVWLSPEDAFDGTILCFFQPHNPCYFSLKQPTGHLVVVDGSAEPRSSSVIDIADVFREAKPLLLTVVSGTAGTAIYADAQPLRQSPDKLLSRHPSHSRLIVGDSSRDSDSWSGEMMGVAIYDTQLTSQEISDDYEKWRTHSMNTSKSRKLLALYLFDEGTGNIVHNVSGSLEPDLYRPQSYFVFDQRLLKPFWQEFDPSRGYVKDLTINVAGFIPLGLFFGAWFLRNELSRPILKTVLFGLVVSLLIELLQSKIPTRHSGTTDLITNTLGTAIGAWFCSLNVATGILQRIGLIAEPNQ